jgi:hypothetical protein
MTAGGHSFGGLPAPSPCGCARGKRTASLPPSADSARNMRRRRDLVFRRDGTGSHDYLCEEAILLWERALALAICVGLAFWCLTLRRRCSRFGSVLIWPFRGCAAAALCDCRTSALANFTAAEFISGGGGSSNGSYSANVTSDCGTMDVSGRSRWYDKDGVPTTWPYVEKKAATPIDSIKHTNRRLPR